MADSGQDHRFQANGVASVIRLLRGIELTWTGKRPLRIEVPSGVEVRSAAGTRSWPASLVLVRPHGKITVRAAYAGPAYLVSSRRLTDTIRKYFVIDVRLQSGWHDNLWPEYLDVYLRNRRWPDSAAELAPAFSKALRRGASSERTRRVRALPWKQRLRHGAARALLARVGREPVARGLAHEHWKALSKAFFNHPDLPAMENAARLISHSFPHTEGCAVIAAEWRADQLEPIMPPRLALASGISITGAATIEAHDERRRRVAGHATVRDADLGPAGGLVVHGECHFRAQQGHVCLAAGEKRAYGVRMPAPIICKGTSLDARASPNRLAFWRRFQHWQAEWRDPDWQRPESQDPQHLRVHVTGDEL